MYQNHLNEEDMQALRKPVGSAARETATQWNQLIAEVVQAHAHARSALFAPYLSDAEAASVLQRQLAHLQNWPPLVALVRAQMLAATPVDAPAVQALMQRWQQLFRDSYCATIWRWNPRCARRWCRSPI